ncbi:MAG TPA: hypothetical protein VK930_04740 [Verrucomicrobiae bacterium]|jgi:hypothetical protein|nr:hypothetical protein [Verrucomicrobiae bacterium]
MQSSSRSSYILHSSVRIAAKTRKFIDRLGTWVLVLALAASLIIVVFWLVAWFENSISLAAAQKTPVPHVALGVVSHSEGESDAFGFVIESQVAVPFLSAAISNKRSETSTPTTRCASKAVSNTNS